MSSKPPSPAVLDRPFRLTDISDLAGATYIKDMSTPSREDSVYLAKLAEQAERYEGESTCYYPSHVVQLTRQKWSRT